MDRILEFTSNHVLLVSALLISFFILVFSELRRKAGGMVNVDTAEAVKLINNDGVVIDIRSADAFARGHIVNARNIPSDEIDGKMSQIENFQFRSNIGGFDAAGHILYMRQRVGKYARAKINGTDIQ